MELLSRRNLIIGLIGTGGVLAWGVGDFAFATPFDFFKGMLHARMPGIRIPDAAIHDFTSDAMRNRNSDFTPKLKLLAGAVRAAGYDLAADVLRKRPDFVGFEREFMTRFLLGSNFFELHDPTKEDVLYFGQPTNCSNPFAIIDPPGEDTPPAPARPIRPERHPLRPKPH